MVDKKLEFDMDEIFFRIEDIPIAATVCDARSLQVIKCNKLFLNMFKLGSDVNLASVSLEEVNKLGASKNIMTLEVNGVSNHLFINMKLFEFIGKEFILYTYEKLMNVFWSDDESLKREVLEDNDLHNDSQIIVVGKDMEYMIDGVYNRKGGVKILSEHMGVSLGTSKFSLVYFNLGVIEPPSVRTQEGFNNAVSIVKHGIRQTDIIVNMDKNEYMLIFPNCAYEVVESIMGTIEKKIDVFNETADVDYEISINYSIAENDPHENISPEQFIEKLRREVL